MGMGLNKVLLIGNLGADPEIRTLNNGGTVANMRIATAEQWKDRDGNRQEKTEWHNIVCFSEGLNTVIEDYCRKGSRIYVEGKLQTRKWQDQSGTDRYSTEVVIDNFNGKLILLDSADSGGDRGRGGGNDRGGGRSRGRDDRSSGSRGGNRVTRNDTYDDRDRQGSFDNQYNGGDAEYSDDRRRRREPERSRPQPVAFDTDLDDDVPF